MPFKRHYKALVAEFGEQEAERYRQLVALRALSERTLSDALSSGIWSSLRARDQLGPLQNSARRLEEALRASKAAREARVQGAIGHQDNGFNWPPLKPVTVVQKR